MFAGLLACPACGGALAADWTCRACGARYGETDGVVDLRLPADARTEAVRDFYGHAPFPGYPPRDSLDGLRARAERSPFARLLDRAIPGDARIVEVGCGTGQMSLYLARAAEPDRHAAWLRDQYQHPEEHRHTHAEVLGWFAENAVDYVRAYPSTLIDDEPDDLFDPAADNWGFEAWLSQVGWIKTLGPEGGLFVMVGRRKLA